MKISFSKKKREVDLMPFGKITLSINLHFFIKRGRNIDCKKILFEFETDYHIAILKANHFLFRYFGLVGLHPSPSHWPTPRILYFDPSSSNLAWNINRIHINNIISYTLYVFHKFVYCLLMEDFYPRVSGRLSELHKSGGQNEQFKGFAGLRYPCF